MANTKYITFPMPVDAQDRINKIFDYMQSKSTSWEPSEGQADTWIFEAVGGESADIGTLASQVDIAIFKVLGQKLFGIPPISAAPATTTVNIFATDSFGHTFPAGMQVGVRDSQGNLIAFRLQADAVIAPSSDEVDNVLVVAAVPGTAGNNLGSVDGNFEQIDTNQFVDVIQQNTVTAGGVDDESIDVYSDRLARELRLLSPTPIQPEDFAVLPQNIAGVQRTLAVDLLNPEYNLLSPNASSVESSVADWTGDNSVPAYSTTVAKDGTHSNRLTCINGAITYMGVHLTGTVPCKAGQVMTALGSFRPGSTLRSVQVGIEFFDISTASLGLVYGSAVAETSTGVWTDASSTQTAPEDAVTAKIYLRVSNAVTSEIHYVDNMSIGRGNAIHGWVLGGTAVEDDERSITTFSLTSNGTAIDSDTKSEVEDYLESLREMNFQVFASDATITEVDVTCSITVLNDYDLGDVQTRVNIAIMNFLSSETWGIAASDDPNNPSTFEYVGKVYYLELAATINNVLGVNRVTFLTLGLHADSQFSADLDLDGYAPVASPGTVLVSSSYE